MSLENEDDSSVMKASESINESEKKLRISYTRDFILSLSELEVCKRLPSGCDQSILREFEENIIHERPRTHGKLPLQEPRVSYNRDFLLSLSELEVCKRLPSGFNQSILREFEENIIHERPRTHGNLPLQGFRRNDYSSSPPTSGDSSNFSRGAYGRWDNRSSGWSDKDGDAQSDLDPDSGRRNNGNQSRRPWKNSEHDGLLGSGSFPRPSGFSGGSSAPKVPTNEHYHLNRSTEAYQFPRPFKAMPHSRPNKHDSFNDETFGSIESTSQDRSEEERKRRASFELMRKEQQKVLQEKQKTSNVKSDGVTDLILEEAKEEGVSEASGELNSAVQSLPKDDSVKSNTLLQSSKPRPLVPPGFKSRVLEKNSTTKLIPSTEKENTNSGIEEIYLLAKGNHYQNETLDNKGNIQSSDHHSNRTSGFSEVNEAVDGEVFELMTNKITGNKIISNSSQENTTSVLRKLFGSDPTTKDGAPTGLQEKINPDSPHNVQSSRFAQWFDEDEKKPVDDFSSSRPNDLLSLIGGGEKDDPIALELPYKGFGIVKTLSDPKHLFNNFRQESAPPLVAAVLTCEDLEQSMMSEYSEKSSNLLPHVLDWSVSSQENVDARAVDSQATHRLLSLLQKGTTINDGPNTNVGPVETHPTFENPKDGDNQEVANSGQNLSLEALFGTAFMKELQSAQAPVSAQRAPPGSARIDIEPYGLSISNADATGPNMKNYETNPLSSRQKQPAKSDGHENWLPFDGQQVQVDQSVFSKQTIGTSKIHLPEEESLIIVDDAANTHNSSTGKMLPGDVAFDVSEKLTVLSSGCRGRELYDVLDPKRQFNNNQNQRPAFHPSHVKTQMRFPDHLMQHENTPISHKFPGNMHVPSFHQPNDRITGFDVNANIQHQMLPQMRIQGNFQPPQMLHDLPRPQASNLWPDHRFPFAHQQTNIGGPGLPISVPVADGSNHPEAFQRMLEMELWAQSKQLHPVSTGNSQGIYGHGLDMGFRYR